MSFSTETTMSVAITEYSNLKLNTSQFNQALIDLGPDAYSNLFRVLIYDNNSNEILSARTTTFLSPSRDVSTTQIPYQNVTVDIPKSGPNIPKTFNMTLRMDSGFESFNILRNKQIIDNFGHYQREESKKLSMKAYAYAPNNNQSTELVPVYEWDFNDMYITSLTQLSFSYESSGALTCNVGFVWGTYWEGKPISEEQVTKLVSDSTRKEREDYLDSVKKTLSNSERVELAKYLGLDDE